MLSFPRRPLPGVIRSLSISSRSVRYLPAAKNYRECGPFRHRNGLSSLKSFASHTRSFWPSGGFFVPIIGFKNRPFTTTAHVFPPLPSALPRYVRFPSIRDPPRPPSRPRESRREGFPFPLPLSNPALLKMFLASFLAPSPPRRRLVA